MDDTKNVIWSLVPLILIILFSWLFGVLGNKMKKPKQEGDVATTKGAEDQPLDIFSALKQAAGQLSAPEGGVEGNDRVPTPTGSQVWRPETGFTGPRVTPKPITPKWWGA
jgi:hypothetical protein